MIRETRAAVRAAREAGKILMSRFGGDLKIRDKGKGGRRDLVTQTDLESNRKIISILKGAFPEYGIFSEESPEEKPGGGKGSDFRWIIDPIDGTHNFVYRIPLFGVSIALEREGRIVLGVINLPCYNQMFTVERGKGSLLNGERIMVSSRGVREAITILGGDTCNPDKRETAELTRGLEEGTFMLRRLGAAVVHFTYLAQGKVDVYVQIGNKPWDNAAGFLLVEEAGGRVTDFKGNPWDINTTRFVASNSRVHEEILEIIKGPA